MTFYSSLSKSRLYLNSIYEISNIIPVEITFTLLVWRRKIEKSAVQHPPDMSSLFSKPWDA